MLAKTRAVSLQESMSPTRDTTEYKYLEMKPKNCSKSNFSSNSRMRKIWKLVQTSQLASAGYNSLGLQVKAHVQKRSQHC